VALVSARQWDEGGAVVELEADGDDFVIAARTWGSHPNLFLFDPRPIWRSMRERKPQILDVHEEPCSLAAAELRLLRRALCPSARLVLYSAQNIFKRYPWPFSMLERGSLRAASGVYVCNREAAQILERKGFTGAIRVLPLGVDLDRFEPGRRTQRGDGAGLRLGYVGRLEERKGLQIVLEAMRNEPTWSLDVVGDGPFAGELRARAAGLRTRVRFRGYVTNDELPDVYRSFDVLVVPSLPTPRWEEQFCRVAVEAMACAVPVVVSANGALPEVVGEGGRLFPPGDHAALRETLRQLEGDGAGRRALGEVARAASRRFAWDAVAAGHRELYDTVLGSSR
jgi:glycosyltransferase involved in cell wall biosynthesis